MPPILSCLTSPHPDYTHASDKPRHQFRPSRSVPSTPQKPGESSPASNPHGFSAGCIRLRSEHASGNSADASFPSASPSLDSFSISYACTHFVHNLYTKTRTATNHVSNLHPRHLYAGTQNKTRTKTSPVFHSGKMQKTYATHRL